MKTRRDFPEQWGYGAFTLGVSQKPPNVAYIKRQAEHHRKLSLEEELLAFWNKHSINYDREHVQG